MSTTQDKAFDTMGLSFPKPPDAAWRVDLLERDLDLLAIFALNAIYEEQDGSKNRATGAIRQVSVAVTFVALASVRCSSVVITNTSGKSISIRRGGSGFVLTLPNNTGKLMDVVSTASEIQVANAEDSDTINVQYELNGEL